MAATQGNRFWEARSTHGRKPIFESPEHLWKACCEYFDWIESNPLWEVKSYMYQGAPVQDQVPKMRAMTISGLCIFLDISDTCWKSYLRREDFSSICTRVEQIIWNQKYQGAAADFLNASIVARELGLKEQTSNEHTGKDGEAIEVNHNVTFSDLTLKVQEVLGRNQP